MKTYSWMTAHSAGVAYSQEEADRQKAAAEKQAAEWMAAGKCPYCGGRKNHAPHLYCGG